MSRWQLSRQLPPPACEAFATLEKVFALEGEPIARDPLSEVIRVTVGGERYYVKRYHAAGKGLRRMLGRPRVKGEWQNLRFFQGLGIPVALVVAWGLERYVGLFGRGAMITLEVPNTLDLATMARNDDPRLADRAWVEGISRQVAQATRTLHAHRFAHNDLKWRNLLVNDRSELFLIDCPTGGFWWGPFLRRRIVKDLACLDKLAKQRLSRTQRLRFFLHYQGRDHLVPEDKPFIDRILRYFEGRE
ncbi:lipopolysaccharide kinase InaA family protein [Stutzerimonas azotifigens]|uniref:lipopolysaccharide kinase InaA family protein n=1 Tax=Stutzerimonas azotifigens TaxID=291995 RepID=UPI0004206002|nr:lipopolysaccharide kinase InaA family protein [Stutzerimonas azotifigens]